MSRVIRLFVGTAAALLLTTGAASAQTVRLSGTLSGSAENPGVLTGATGTCEVFVNVQQQTVNYTVDVFNLPSGATGGHFHVGGVGLNGPVVVDLTPQPNISNDFTLSGSVAQSALRVRAEQGIRSWADFIQSLLGGQMYINIHSAVNPGGETRCQLTQDPGQDRH
jgi:hypothetical protein